MQFDIPTTRQRSAFKTVLISSSRFVADDHSASKYYKRLLLIIDWYTSNQDLTKYYLVISRGLRIYWAPGHLQTIIGSLNFKFFNSDCSQIFKYKFNIHHLVIFRNIKLRIFIFY